MPEDNRDLPLDAQLLSSAIIELNIARHSVAMYPADHPSIKKTLDRAQALLQKLFELRPDIVLAVAKDTLIIDDYYLDRKNPVFRELANMMSGLSIAYIKFSNGLRTEELYEFNKVLSRKPEELSPESIQNHLKEKNVTHIVPGFIDYDYFVFEEGKLEVPEKKGQIWERYIYGLLDGTLRSEDAEETVWEIPPEVLAGLLNRKESGNIKEETYDKVVTTYLRSSSERAFSHTDVQRLMAFIGSLRPELKKQFLSSTSRVASKNIGAMEKALHEMPVDGVIGLIKTVNEQMVAIPESFKNLMDKFSEVCQEGLEDIYYGDGMIVDDIFLSPELTKLFSEDSFESFVTEEYRKDLQKLMEFDLSRHIGEKGKDISLACRDEVLSQDYCKLLLDLLSSDVLSDESHAMVLDRVKELSMLFIERGQYGDALNVIKVSEKIRDEGRFPQLTSSMLEYFHSEEFISLLMDSLHLMGRLFREEAALLVYNYGKEIVPALLDTLAYVESATVRRFFITLIVHFGEEVVPEVSARLLDKRWYVKRNMLFILNECSTGKRISYVRTCCHHEDPRVSFEALKYLFRTGDRYGIDILRRFLHSDSREIVEQSIALAGGYRVREVVPDLVKLLSKKWVLGTDIHEKTLIIKALGAIADSRALEALKRLLIEKHILFKGARERLREEIYRTLKKYPYGDIEELVEAGLKSRNDNIRKESLILKEGRSAT